MTSPSHGEDPEFKSRRAYLYVIEVCCLRYNVRVKFHQDFLKVSGNTIVAGIKAEPQKGEANRELIGKVAKHFKLSPSRIRILSGKKSRSKVLEVE